MALVVKNPPANAGDVRDVGSVPGGDPLVEGMATHSSILAWRTPRTEEPGGLQSIASQSQTQLRTARYIPGVGLLDHTIGQFLVCLKETPYCSL